jgi:hypothetical protein
MIHEAVPLASIVREVLSYVSERPDAVLFGAQAVNAYCDPPRMTEEVDIVSTGAGKLATDLAAYLGPRLHIAVRVREVAGGAGFRVYQLRQPKNRHLVDVRSVVELPEHRIIEGVRVVAPAELVALKAISASARSKREKGLSDRLDLARLLRAFPELRADEVSMASRLERLGADANALNVWREAALHPLEPDDDDQDA